jgi:hypothetical protein
LIVSGEGRQSHGGSLALSARITRRFQQASLLGKSPDLQPIPLPFPGRRQIYTRSPGSPQELWDKKFLTHRRVGPTRRCGADSYALLGGKQGLPASPEIKDFDWVMHRKLS